MVTVVPISPALKKFRLFGVTISRSPLLQTTSALHSSQYPNPSPTGPCRPQESTVARPVRFASSKSVPVYAATVMANSPNTKMTRSIAR